MRQFCSCLSVLLLAVLAAAPQIAIAQDRDAADAAVPVATDSRPSQNSVTGDVPTRLLAERSAPLSPAAVFRDIPSISGRYSFRGTTVLPYLGAGFGGGYTSDLNRSLGNPLPAPTDSSLRSQFGQGFSPNEFQMGLRIPF